jgi:hypothetical protein
MKNAIVFASLCITIVAIGACSEDPADSPADGVSGVGASGATTTGAAASGAASSAMPASGGATDSMGGQADTTGASASETDQGGAQASTDSTDVTTAGPTMDSSDTTTETVDEGSATDAVDGSDTTTDPATSTTTTDDVEPADEMAEDSPDDSAPLDGSSGGAGGETSIEDPMDDVGIGGMGGMVAVDEPDGEPSGDGTACGAAGLSFCTDFEAEALPAELEFFPEYQRENIANFVTIDSTQAHSGTRSARFAGAEFSQMLAVATPGATFWGRVYLMSDTDIQSGHNTYVAATDGTGDPNDGEHIRIGEHQCQLEVNRKSDDAEQLSNGGDYMCSGGFEMLADTWYCLEFFYDGAGSELQVFVDGAEIPELHNTDWGPYQYTLFKFGFEKYHGDNKNLWYDDVALGTERIGCFD